MNDAPHKRRGRPPKVKPFFEPEIHAVPELCEPPVVVNPEPVKTVSDAYSRWGALLGQIRNLRA